jgi:hypothetical protein
MLNRAQTLERISGIASRDRRQLDTMDNFILNLALNVA